MIQTRFKTFFTAALFNFALKRNCECNFCHSQIHKFLPYRGGWKNQPKLMRLLRITGSDVDHFGCPVCGAHDRERHLKMYLDRLQITSQLTNASILHFAPEQKLSQYISEQNPSLYLKADLFPTSEDIVKIDMCDIPYPENSFDFVIANHVLEHVNNLSTALHEIQRVIKIDGYAILQTPFSAQLAHSFEDPGINNDMLRLEIYGQEDHVRLFGQDIIDVIASYGFMSHCITHEKALSNIDARYWGVNIKEPFFFFQKKPAHD